MKRIVGILISTACAMFYACSQNPSIDSTDFVLCTENVEGDETYYSKLAVITGHIGAGIPFYILIDKGGVIVDFGEHLRPSIPETRGIIDKYIS